jgi:hypothetical protein
MNDPGKDSDDAATENGLLEERFFNVEPNSAAKGALFK